MSPNRDPEVSAKVMLALRNEPEALKAITAQLRVKEMGPADHIRTKHEVKAWLETSGDVKEADAIIIRARARRELRQESDRWARYAGAVFKVLRATRVAAR